MCPRGGTGPRRHAIIDALTIDLSRNTLNEEKYSDIWPTGEDRVDNQQYQDVFSVIAEAYNSQVDSDVLLERTGKSLVEDFGLKGCHFLILGREQKALEPSIAYGLSDTFLNKGPIDAERSVREALKGQCIMIKDCSTDDRIQYPAECSKEGITSLLTVPLKSRGQVIGVMRLSTSKAREFSTDEISFFETVATFCAGAIVHSMFYKILGNVTEAISSPLGLKEVLDSIVQTVTENLRSRGCSIRLLDAKSGQLEMSASCVLSQGSIDQIAGKAGTGVHKALEGHCVMIRDARTDPLIVNRDAMNSERISSILFVPMTTRKATIGVLSLYTNKVYEFSDDEKKLMSAIGDQCALAIRNAQMYSEIEKRYKNVVDEFHQWFEHFHTYPPGE